MDHTYYGNLEEVKPVNPLCDFVIDEFISNSIDKKIAKMKTRITSECEELISNFDKRITILNKQIKDLSQKVEEKEKTRISLMVPDEAQMLAMKKEYEKQAKKALKVANSTLLETEKKL